MMTTGLQQQRGATLVIALVLLLIITVLAISSMREVALEERLVGNLRDHQASLNAAESALRAGETIVAESATPLPTCPTSAPNCANAARPSATQLSATTWSGWASFGQPFTDSLAKVPNQPRWYLSFIGFDPANSAGVVEVTNTDERSKGVGPYYYSVVAAGTGRTSRSLTVLESTTVQRY